MKITIIEMMFIAELIWFYFKDVLLFPVWVMVILIILQIIGWLLDGVLKYYTKLLETKRRKRK